MKMNRILIVVACAGIFGGCAATVPKELVSAREAYRRASTGPAGQVAPADVHVANQALARAEQSFEENPDSYQTRDLAYVAERKSQLAEANASIAMEKKNQAQANSDYQSTQGSIIANTKQDLTRTQTTLAASERSGQMTAAQLAAEKNARAAAEKRAADAMAALAKLAAVKDEPRGMVITLSGSVLFASNQATLLPEARTRLDQVAAVLLTTKERNLVVEGHTDSRGTDAHNIDLSQRRADAVRSYLVQQGYESDRIQAHGLGKGTPVADNGNAEGRANNRRVEIIIERESHAANR
ncbi:MAG: OmpA family protein [Deltaproteobacteria bacterium]|nr:OmpA family protein [Deltaproteobacteria bacterium]